MTVYRRASTPRLLWPKHSPFRRAGSRSRGREPGHRPGPAVFAGNLRMYRQARGPTQTDVAKRSDISAGDGQRSGTGRAPASVHQGDRPCRGAGTFAVTLTLWSASSGPGQRTCGSGDRCVGHCARASIPRCPDRAEPHLLRSRQRHRDSDPRWRSVLAAESGSPPRRIRRMEKVWEEMKTYFPVFVRHLAGKLVERASAGSSARSC